MNLFPWEKSRRRQVVQSRERGRKLLACSTEFHLTGTVVTADGVGGERRREKRSQDEHKLPTIDRAPLRYAA